VGPRAAHALQSNHVRDLPCGSRNAVDVRAVEAGRACAAGGPLFALLPVVSDGSGLRLIKAILYVCAATQRWVLPSQLIGVLVGARDAVR
jgi:hypothetical protein